MKYGFQHVAARIYKLDAKRKSGGFDLKIDVQEPDSDEPTEQGRLDGMSDGDILEGYTSEESVLARALAGTGMEEDSDTEAVVAVVETLKVFSDTLADQSSPQ